MRKLFFLLIAIIAVPLSGFSKYWIIFQASEMSANSITGHAFVSFIKSNAALKQTIVVGTWGFYPKDGIGVFGYVDGEIKDDANRIAAVSMMVEVTEKEFDLALLTKIEWENNKYSFNTQNCVSFIRAIVTVVSKLDQPGNSTKMPKNYIDNLKLLNKQYEVTQTTNNTDKPSDVPITKAVNKSKILWYTWTSLPNADKARLRTFYESESNTVYDDINESLKENCEIKIAKVDLNGDKENGYLIYKYSCTYSCGTMGCTLDVFEDKGKKQIHLGIHEDQLDKIKIAKNGIIGSSGIYFELKEN